MLLVQHGLFLAEEKAQVLAITICFMREKSVREFGVEKAFPFCSLDCQQVQRWCSGSSAHNVCTVASCGKATRNCHSQVIQKPMGRTRQFERVFSRTNTPSTLAQAKSNGQCEDVGCGSLIHTVTRQSGIPFAAQGPLLWCQSRCHRADLFYCSIHLTRHNASVQKKACNH